LLITIGLLLIMLAAYSENVR